MHVGPLTGLDISQRKDRITKLGLGQPQSVIDGDGRYPFRITVKPVAALEGIPFRLCNFLVCRRAAIGLTIATELPICLGDEHLENGAAATENTTLFDELFLKHGEALR